MPSMIANYGKYLSLNSDDKLYKSGVRYGTISPKEF